MMSLTRLDLNEPDIYNYNNAIYTITHITRSIKCVPLFVIFRSTHSELFCSIGQGSGSGSAKVSDVGGSTMVGSDVTEKILIFQTARANKNATFRQKTSNIVFFFMYIKPKT